MEDNLTDQQIKEAFNIIKKLRLKADTLREDAEIVYLKNVIISFNEDYQKIWSNV